MNEALFKVGNSGSLGIPGCFGNAGRPSSTVPQAGALTLLVLALLGLIVFNRHSPHQTLDLGGAQYTLGLSQFVGSAPAPQVEASSATLAAPQSEPPQDFQIESKPEFKSEPKVVPEPKPEMVVAPDKANLHVNPEPKVEPKAVPVQRPVEAQKVTPKPKPEPQETPRRKQTQAASKVVPAQDSASNSASAQAKSSVQAQAKAQTLAQSQVQAKTSVQTQTQAQALAKAPAQGSAGGNPKVDTGATQAGVTPGGAAGGNAPTLMVYGRDAHPVLAQIKAAIDRSLVYPRKSRMLREQGVAVVQFVYTPQGKLYRLTLLRSTGSKALDKAAIHAIKLASGNFPAVERAYTLRLPITFNLR